MPTEDHKNDESKYNGELSGTDWCYERSKKAIFRVPGIPLQPSEDFYLSDGGVVKKMKNAVRRH